MMPEQTKLHFATEADWEAWLEANHTTSDGVWLMHAKKGGGETSVTYLQAVDVALCFGWIDGQKGSLDDKFFLQRFTPRRKKSIWSQVNRENVARLTAAGRMREAGMKEVEEAKTDGRWDAAYASGSQMEEPEDFLAALEQNPAAKVFYATLNKTNRYAIYHQVITAKKPETRAARIAKFMDMLNEGKKLY
jgi:uncharacterized protein YdeI (YjbR/CyaY-like superfamily)